MAERIKNVMKDTDGTWYFIDMNGHKVGGFADKEKAEYALDIYWKSAIGGVVKK